MKYKREFLKKKLGEVLVEMAAINQDQLEQALFRQQRSNAKVGQVLMELGYITDEQLEEALAIQNSREMAESN